MYEQPKGFLFFEKVGTVLVSRLTTRAVRKVKPALLKIFA